MRKVLLFLTCCTLYGACHSQCLATFTDVNNNVYLFDGSQEVYLSSLPLLSQKMGRAGIAAYIVNSGAMKVFYKGKIYPVTDNTPNYFMTDYWFVYQNYTLVRVLESDSFKTLETQFDQGEDSIYVTDSLVIWNNDLGDWNVYQHGGKTQIFERTDISGIKRAPNLFVYIDLGGSFKMFYHGESQTLEAYQPTQYSVSEDMLMYIDLSNNMKIFHDGVMDETSIPAPNRYKMGKDFLSYINELNQLTIYYKGKDTVILEDQPAYWAVRKNMMVFADHGNNFYCWYKGQIYWLERYVPPKNNIQIGNDIVVYTDLDGRLRGFYYGEQLDVTDQIPVSWQLVNEGVVYSLQPYETKIWCNKQTFTF